MHLFFMSAKMLLKMPLFYLLILHQFKETYLFFQRPFVEYGEGLRSMIASPINFCSFTRLAYTIVVFVWTFLLQSIYKAYSLINY